MADDIRVLLAGEAWVSHSMHLKGFDFFASTSYEVGTEHLAAALSGGGFAFEHLPSHLAAADFPSTIEALSAYDVVVLSDIGANTLLLPPQTFVGGKPSPNRLQLLADWVAGGGGLAMCGGYLSFAGMYGSAKYYRTAVESVLPVDIHTFDDRVETPEGVVADVVRPNHPILAGLGGEWPPLLGFNELTPKADGEVLAKAGEHPLLAVRTVGRGRTLAWASDIGPHWCPEPFLKWEGYGRLWRQAIGWLAGRD